MKTALASQRLLLARIGAETFAFPLADVLEVAEAPVVTPLPMLPSGVVGQSMHRDRLLPVIDAGVLLGVSRAAPTGVLLVIDVDGERAALWADDVIDIVKVQPPQRRPVPAGSGTAGAMLGGVVDLGWGIAALVAMDEVRAAVRARLLMEVA